MGGCKYLHFDRVVKRGAKNNRFVLKDRRQFLYSLLAPEAGNLSV